MALTLSRQDNLTLAALAYALFDREKPLGVAGNKRKETTLQQSLQVLVPVVSSFGPGVCHVPTLNSPEIEPQSQPAKEDSVQFEPQRSAFASLKQCIELH
jgi:hypothetical protein